MTKENCNQCGKESTVFWNEGNGVVQCHNCGAVISNETLWIKIKRLFGHDTQTHTHDWILLDDYEEWHKLGEERMSCDIAFWEECRICGKEGRVLQTRY